jgi:hypothetical protein
VAETASGTPSDMGTSSNGAVPAAADSASQPTSSGSVPGISTAEATTSAPPAAQRSNDPTVTTSWTHVRWRHRTNAGTRWSLTVSDPEHPILFIDLGDANLATVTVAKEFLNLDAAGMALRVDFLRDKITKDFGTQSASFSFMRDGQVRSNP